MNNSSLNMEVLQTLSEFENLPGIEASSGWNQSLMDRIAAVKPRSNSGNSVIRFAVIILFAALVNLGFVLNTMLHTSHKTTDHNNELQVISKELLINPTSLNN